MKLKLILITSLLAVLSSATNYAQQSQTQSPTVVQLNGLSQNLTAMQNPKAEELEMYLKKAKSYITTDISTTPTTEKVLLGKKQAVLDQLNQMTIANLTSAKITAKITDYLNLL